MWTRSRYEICKSQRHADEGVHPKNKTNGIHQGQRGSPRIHEGRPKAKGSPPGFQTQDQISNPDFAPFQKKRLEDITLVQINSDRSDEEINQDPNPTTPLEVSISNFIVRPQLLGNMSGDEEVYEKDGTPILVKIEQKSDDSEEEEAKVFSRGTQTDLPEPRAEPVVGESDSSSEDDDEPPADGATDEARDKVAFKLTKEIHADTLTATALVQALKKLGFEFPVGQGVTKKCGVDFIKVEVPKAA